jgi:hypothetical protein
MVLLGIASSISQILIIIWILDDLSEVYLVHCQPPNELVLDGIREL